MRTLAVMCVALICAVALIADHASTMAGPFPPARIPVNPPKAQSAQPIAPPVGPNVWKCDGSVRDHRARECQAWYCPNPSSYPHGGCPSVRTYCAINDSTPIGCSCDCRVTIDNGAGQTFAKGEVVSATH